MDIETLRSFLAWCSTFNLVLLVLWWLGFMLWSDGIRRLHGKWFEMSRESFDKIHYTGMAFFKMLVLMFNLVPYLVLRFFF